MSLISLIAGILRLSESETQEMETLLENPQNRGKKAKIREEIETALKDAPRIGLIGKTGAGKSSTINALFNPRKPFKVGHVRATTHIPQELEVNLGHGRGKLIVVDFPGLGESIQADEKTLAVYREHLAKCDVALWVISANDRTYSYDQALITQVLTSRLKNRLVIGISQIDLIQPGHWAEEFNVPSREQEKSMQQKVRDVRSKLKEIGVTSRQVVPYSAHKRYHLMHLFTAMLEACPTKRRWVLDEHKAIAEFVVPGFASSPSLSSEHLP